MQDVVTAMVGLGIVLLFVWANRPLRAENLEEPDEEPVSADPTSVDDPPAASSSNDAPQPSASSGPRQPTVNDYLEWLIERVERRYRQARTNERIVLYGERVTIMHGLRAAANSEHQGFRDTALRSLGNLSDISDDENSPNYELINRPASLGDASRAARFIVGLQTAGRCQATFSTNVDMAYNAWLRNLNHPPQDESDEDMDEDLEEETVSEASPRSNG